MLHFCSDFSGFAGVHRGGHHDPGVVLRHEGCGNVPGRGADGVWA